MKKTTQFKKWAKDLRHFTQEDKQTTNNMQKDAPYHMTSNKCILKQQGDTSTYLLKWQKFISPNAGKNMEQQKLSFMAGGNARCYIHVGRQFDSFFQN